VVRAIDCRSVDFEYTSNGIRSMTTSPERVPFANLDVRRVWSRQLATDSDCTTSAPIENIHLDCSRSTRLWCAHRRRHVVRDGATAARAAHDAVTITTSSGKSTIEARDTSQRNPPHSSPAAAAAAAAAAQPQLVGRTQIRSRRITLVVAGGAEIRQR
jgi:hypothetical protein